MKILVLFAVLFFPVFALAEPLPKEAHIDTGTSAKSKSGKWEVFMTQNEQDGPFQICLSCGGEQKSIPEISKPICSVIWLNSEKYIVIVKYIGFCTMVDIFRLGNNVREVEEIFSSEKTNLRPYVDYRFVEFDKKNNLAILEVYENLIYSEDHHKKRLLAIEYIYLDGKTKYK